MFWLFSPEWKNTHWSGINERKKQDSTGFDDIVNKSDWTTILSQGPPYLLGRLSKSLQNNVPIFAQKTNKHRFEPSATMSLEALHFCHLLTKPSKQPFLDFLDGLWHFSNTVTARHDSVKEKMFSARTRASHHVSFLDHLITKLTFLSAIVFVASDILQWVTLRLLWRVPDASKQPLMFTIKSPLTALDVSLHAYSSK